MLITIVVGALILFVLFVALCFCWAAADPELTDAEREHQARIDASIESLFWGKQP